MVSGDKELNAKVNINNSDIEGSIELQKQLYDILIGDNFNYREFINKLNEYQKKYSRFFYSYITKYILDEEYEENIGRLLGNINFVTDRIYVGESKYDIELFENESHNDKVGVSHEQYLMIFKLYDHCHLANKQRIEYEATKADIEGRVTEIVNSAIEEYEKRTEPKIRDYEKSITSQLIGIVSIFTALSFVVFGGINSFGNIFQMIKTAPLSRILIILDIWFICMFNLFALFMKMIAILTDHQFKIRYYVILINIVLSMFLFIMIFCNYYKII